MTAGPAGVRIREPHCTGPLVLRNASVMGTVEAMAWSENRQDPERRRRRLHLLAALAEARSAREGAQPEQLPAARLRKLIANRRRLTN